MKTMRQMILMMLLVIATACQAQYPEYTDIDVQSFHEQMKSDSVTILDVRTPGEIAEGIIEGAVIIDFYEEDFADQILKLNKEDHIMVYCAAGGRSARAAAILNSSGFKKVSNLDGGMKAWEKAKLPVVSP